MSHGPLTSFDPHSPQAGAIASLFGQTLVVCAVIGVLVAVLVGVCAVRFRERAGAGEPAQVHGHTTLEIAWTVVPLLIVIALVVLSARAMASSDPPADRDPDVVVVGHQWWWEVRYPGGAVTANEVHIPTDKDILVGVESDDVVHDFWVPQLGRKIDAIPGHPSSIWIRADAPATYPGACAEYCGSEHAWMRIAVVAQPPADYERWEWHQMATAEAPTTLAAVRGKALFRGKTCVGCHTIRSSGWPGPNAGALHVAPDLTHLVERATLGAGVLPNDPPGLTRWLREPQVVKPASHMPDLKLSDEELGDLVAYLETLR